MMKNIYISRKKIKLLDVVPSIFIIIGAIIVWYGIKSGSAFVFIGLIFLIYRSSWQIEQLNKKIEELEKRVSEIQNKDKDV
jgi:hypothetical protein